MPNWRHSAVFVHISIFFLPPFLQQTNEQQVGYISFKNFTESKSHWTVSVFFLFFEEIKDLKNSGLLLLNSGQTVLMVIIAHWKFER